MRSIVIAACLVAMMADSVFAGPFRRQASAPASTSAYSAPMANSTAQGVAEMMARSNSCRHFGGNTGYEGVGYSTRSADDAIRNCCYWGQRKPREIGVARGKYGHFACVRYH